MNEKRKILLKMVLLLTSPIFFGLIYGFLPVEQQKNIDNIYRLPAENEVYVFGKSLLNHGTIKVSEKQNWENLIAKLRINKNYYLNSELAKKELPNEFFIKKAVNFDDYFIRKKDSKIKKNNHERFNTKPIKTRRLRYR